MPLPHRSALAGFEATLRRVLFAHVVPEGLDAAGQERAYMLSAGGVVGAVLWGIAAAIHGALIGGVLSWMIVVMSVLSLAGPLVLWASRSLQLAGLVMFNLGALALLVIAIVFGGPHNLGAVVLPVILFAAALVLRGAAYRTYVVTLGLVPTVATVANLAGWVDPIYPLPAPIIVFWWAGSVFSLVGAHVMGSVVQRHHEREAERIAYDEGRFRLAARSARVGVWEWDEMTERHRVTASLVSLLDAPSEPFTHDIARHVALACLDADDFERLNAALAHTYASGESEYFELRLRNAPEQRWIGVHMVAETTDDGKPQRVVAAIRDLSAEKERERHKSQFIANMSHELRTPLTGIVGTADLMDDGQLPERYRRGLTTIRRSGQHMLRTISDVLDFARIEADALDLQTRPVELRTTVDGAMAMFAASAAEKGLELTYHLDADVPERVQSDGGRISQILINLIGNAVKFTQNGSIEVNVACAGDRVEMRVVDTGRGIAPEMQTRIFSPYEQAERTMSRRAGGQGLGLAISRRLAALLGGTLTVTSRLGTGSEFRLSLPLSGEPPADVPFLDGQIIGLVGCSERVAHVVASSLRRHGADPRVAATLEALGDGRLDTVIMPYALVEGARSVLADTHPSATIVAIAPLASTPTPLAGALIVQQPLGGHAVVEALRQRMVPSSIDRSLPNQLIEPMHEAHPMQVLVVEDDPIAREVTSGLIEREGYDVVTVESGADALHAATETVFDFVLMDLHMPGLDGIEATRRIRDAGLGRPYVAAYTADVTVETRQACDAAGLDEVLAKPARRRALRDALGRAYQFQQERRGESR